MNGHAQNLARAVLLYFGETTQRNIAADWRITTGSADFSGATLMRLARRLLDDAAIQERAARAREREERKK